MAALKGLGSFSAERQQLLRLRLKEKGVQAPVRDTIPRRAPSDLPPALSFAQQRLWLIDRLIDRQAGGSPLYNTPAAVRLAGALHGPALFGAVTEIVRRHEALRTTFQESADGADGAVQVVSREPGFGRSFVDLSGLPVAFRETELARVAGAEVERPFDLERGPLLRTLLVRLTAEDHAFVFTCHHIVSDGWSCGVFVREMVALYQAFAAGSPSPLPPLAIQYADFAGWQRSRLTGALLESELAYWRDHLAGAPADLELPADRPRRAEPSLRGAWSNDRYDADLTDAVRALGRREDATLFMVLLAAFAALLGRLSGQDDLNDLVIGSPIANRNREELEGLIGFFVNTLALRADLSGDPDVRELLARTRRTAHGAFAHQDLPFERIVEELRPDRVAGRNPLFQVSFAVQNVPLPALRVPGLDILPLDLDTGTAKFDLSLFFTEHEDVLLAGLEYPVERFDPATISRLLGHLRILLAGAVADPGCRLSALPLLAEPERHQLVTEWNDTAGVSERHLSITALFAAQAARTPDAPAVIFGERRLTYAELDRESDRLARRLAAVEVGPERLVGLSLERSAGLIVAMLAVLKAGGAYLPLDPAHPEARRSALLAEAGVRVLVVRERPGIPAGLDVLSVSLTEDDSAEAPFRGPASPASLAYVLFTSGSTGRPKGVAISHRSVVRLAREPSDARFAPGDRVAQASNPAFDAMTCEVWGALLNGACLVGIEQDVLLSPRELAAALRREGITAMFLTAALFHEVVRNEPSAFAPLDRLLVGGETVDPRRVREALAGGLRRFVDAYGPTECTTFATLSSFEQVADGARALPLGYPIPETRALLADRGLRLVPLGATGEILLGGDGLARGYLGRPDLTAELFVPDPFGGGGERLYRTGDLARRLPDGRLEFLGRRDAQVKVRGVRIEPAEVEAALTAHPAVARAAVLPREQEGSRVLVAAVVLSGEATAAGLRAFLRESLPEAMIPAAFVFLPEIPLTPSHKVDRRALLGLIAAEAAGATADEPPRGPVEEVLAGLFVEVLGSTDVGRHDSFFDLGGHSLLAISIQSRVRSALGLDLPLRSLFEAPTVAGLAKWIDEERRGGAPPAPPPVVPVERSAPLPLSFSQERLWLVDRLDPGSPLYNVPAAVRLRGPLSVAALTAALAAMVERHEILRTHYVMDATGRPVQIVDPPQPPAVPVVDLTAIPDPAREAEELAWEESLWPFDLATGPVLRALLIRLDTEDHLAVLTRHHVATDGWSTEIFAREMAILYGAFSEGRPSPLPALPVQYADFAVWQRGWLTAELLAAQLSWWRERLAGAPPLLDLPADRPRPAVRTGAGEIRETALAPAFLGAVRDLARCSGGTLFMAFLAAFAAVVRRTTGIDDLVLGSPLANRPRPELEGLVGFFANTLVLRTDLSGDPPFRELLGRVRETSLGAWDHQDLPFERLVDELRPPRTFSHAPIFQVMFVHQAMRHAGGSDSASLLRAEPLPGRRAVSRYDLEVYCLETPDGMTLALEYSTDLFDAARMIRLLGHLRNVLAGAIRDPDARLSDLPLLSPAETHQILLDWDSGIAPQGEGLLHELVEDQARRTPDALALIAGEERWTYRELLERAGRIAHHLRAQGVGPEVRVGVSLPKSGELVACLLGVLQAGGAYVPIDPALPAARRERIVADAQPALLLSQPKVGEGLAPSRRLSATNLAYLIYTSGSTGEPKGVAITHANAVSLVRWACQVFPPEDLARVLAGTSIGFDLFVFELFVPLSRGGTVVLAESALDLPRLAAEGITLINTVPSVMAELVRTGAVPPTVRTVNLAGEALPRDLADRIAALPGRPRLLNLYGPSEDTTYSTFAPIAGGESGAPPIGRPLPGTRALVLDDTLQPLPIGVAGELFLGGTGLARGYLGRPDRTAERWLPDPFGAPGERLYRTGDLARLRPDGGLDFLGRRDHQVKIRGVRIELGEIEEALARHPAVAQAAAGVRQDRGETILAAWVVPNSADGDAPSLPPTLRAYLQELFPAALIPTSWTILSELPRMASGKLDRRALLALEGQEAASAVREHTAPRDPIEELLAAEWAAVLGERVAGREIGVHDNFFDLGGHSLMAFQLIARLLDSLGIELPVRTLFEAPTIAEQALLLLDSPLAREVVEELGSGGGGA